jgi:hypothetical protein
MSGLPLLPLTLLSSNSEHGCQAAFNIGLSCGAGRDADPHGCLSLPDGAVAPTGAISLKMGDYAAGQIITAKRDEYLVDDKIVENPVARCPQAIGKARGMPAGTLDQIGDTGTAQRTAPPRPRYPVPAAMPPGCTAMACASLSG